STPFRPARMPRMRPASVSSKGIGLSLTPFAWPRRSNAALRPAPFCLVVPARTTPASNALTGRVDWASVALHRWSPDMRIGLDLDGLLDERPDFFAFLTAALRAGGHFVAVLTYRDPDSRARTEAQLAVWSVQYDELHFARSLSDKGRL